MAKKKAIKRITDKQIEKAIADIEKIAIKFMEEDKKLLEALS